MKKAAVVLLALVTFVCVSTSRARAQDLGPAHLVVPSFADDIPATPTGVGDEPQAATPRPVAIEYGEGYELRAKIHKYASFATLPLFATEVALGQSLYNDSSRDSRRGAHAAVGAAIGGLFAVNSVTGVWNMWASRNDPHGRTLRLVHGLLMLTADAGFLATAASTPEGDRRGALTFTANAQTHRTIALTSIAIASVGYLTMLIGAR
jgi:hypothetical protein